MAKATTTKTATQSDATVTNLSNVTLPPVNADTEIAVGELKSDTTDTVMTDDNAPIVETYTIAHAENDDAQASKVNDVAIDVADISADKQATIQPINAKIGGFKVQWQLRHNGKVYHAGDSVTLTAEEAQTLLATGVIVATEE